MNKWGFLIALGIIPCLVLLSLTALIPTNTAQAQSANSSWPMFGQNPQRTGRSPYSGPDSSSLKWSFNASSYISSSPTIGADGTIYVGSYDYNLYAVNPDGTQKWSFATGGLVFSSPAIGADGTIYVGSADGNLYALSPDGSQKWSFKTGGYVTSSPAIGTDGVIYFGSYDDNLYALNPDGSQRWRFTPGNDVKSSPAIGVDGTVYIGSADNNLYAVTEAASSYWPLIGALIVALVAAGLVIFLVHGKRSSWLKGRRRIARAQGR
jgi:hypothetical protein